MFSSWAKYQHTCVPKKRQRLCNQQNKQVFLLLLSMDGLFLQAETWRSSLLSKQTLPKSMLILNVTACGNTWGAYYVYKYKLLGLPTWDSGPVGLPGAQESECWGSTSGGLKYWSSGGKASVCSAGDPGSISGLGRSPRGGNGSPLQHSCMKTSKDRGAWRATCSPWGGKELNMTEQLTF